MTGQAKQLTVFELSFPKPDRPMSENEARGASHWVISSRLDPWKTSVRFAWGQARGRRDAIVGVPCFVQMDLPFERRLRRDPSNYVGTVVKACVDMLVHMGTWPDDDPEWVTVVEPNIVIGDVAVLRLIPRELGMLRSRAVLRPIDPGNDVLCVHCVAEGMPVPQCRLKFSARVDRSKRVQVVANVYDGPTWVRVDHYHPECYVAAGEPCGPATA